MNPVRTMPVEATDEVNGRRSGPRVLVTFASRHGATRETAATVARELTRAGRARGGLEVVLAPVQRQPDAVAFDAVVLGSAVYGGRWLEPALQWVERMSSVLRERPVWLFSGSVPTIPSPRTVGDGRWVADALGAREHRSFGGRVEQRLLSPAEQSWYPAVVGGDQRDWTAVTDWSVRIAAEIAERSAPAGVR
jgi:menaquinone-dependent protoporphyrinogen oxidase